MRVELAVRPYGALPDGSRVECYTITCGAFAVEMITFGAIITAIRLPDRHGRVANVVLGYSALEPYLHNPHYIGAIVGRFANRIAHGHFELDHAPYRLTCNDGPHHLHGGAAGFSRRLWSATPVASGDAAGVVFSRRSPHGEEGYPGSLDATVSYLVTADRRIRLTYRATADASTIVNLTQHTYFNLTGDLDTSALAHQLTLYADAYTPVGPGLIPSGVVAPVDGTPFDFRTPTPIARRLGTIDPQLELGGGLDHNLVLARVDDAGDIVAELRDPHSGRMLRIATTEPGIQVYGGQLLDGRRGTPPSGFAAHAGVCLETQHFPDSPHHANFPSAVLRPGHTYASTTEWRFAAE